MRVRNSTGRVIEVPEQTSDRYLSQTWKQVADTGEPCPTCGAIGDEPCVTASGNTTDQHATRA